MKKALALLMALVMVVGMIPTAWAAEENEVNVGTVDEFIVALENADADIITLTADIDLTEKLNSGTAVFDVSGKTIDLNKKTITSKNFSIVYEGIDFTIKNGNLVAANNGSYALFIGNGTVEGNDGWTADVSIEDVTTTGGINVYVSENVVLRNVTADGTKVSGTSYYAIWCDMAGNVIVESGSYTSNATKTTAILGISETDASLTIKGGDFITNGKELSLSTGYASPVIQGGTFDVDPTAYVAAGYIADQRSDGKYIVGDYTAKIGDTYYATLTDAVKAAQTNDTIVMVDSCEEQITLPVGVTLALNGKTLTNDPLAPENYSAVKNTTAGTWTVSKKADTVIVEGADTVFEEGDTTVKQPELPADTPTEATDVANALTTQGAKVEVTETVLEETTINNAVEDAVTSTMQNKGINKSEVDKIIVEPVTTKQVKDVTLNENNETTSVTFNVTANLSITIVKSGGDKEPAGTVPLAESRTLIPVVLPAPEEWPEGTTVYVVHEKADGTKYYYTLKVANQTVTIPNDKGFSTFTMSTERPADYPSGGGGSGAYMPAGHTVTSPFVGVDKVYVDGALVKAEDYIVYGGNVRLKQSYMDGLKAGTHTVKIVYGERTSTGTFTTKGAGTVQSAKTFDAGIIVYGMMALGSAMSAAYVSRKKKN